MTMSAAEVKKLLIMAMAFDNRQPGAAQVAAWHDVADRERWTFDEAREALRGHYAESTDYLLPGHITARIKTMRQQPPSLPDLAALPPRKPASPQHIRKVINELSVQRGWQHDEVEADLHRRALAVQCPHCHATPGVPCTAMRNSRRGERMFRTRKTPHPSRLDLVRDENAASDESERRSGGGR